jgi:putative endonuclease
MHARFFVYILASRRYGTLYIGMTNDLARRLEQHRSGAVPGFTKAYGVHQLVHYEVHESLEAARERERRLKGWRREWKISLIEEGNLDWSDLSPTLVYL